MKLNVFEQGAERTVPEKPHSSHDLLEGCYVEVGACERCAAV